MRATRAKVPPALCATGWIAGLEFWLNCGGYLVFCAAGGPVKAWLGSELQPNRLDAVRPPRTPAPQRARSPLPSHSQVRHIQLVSADFAALPDEWHEVLGEFEVPRPAEHHSAQNIRTAHMHSHSVLCHHMVAPPTPHRGRSPRTRPTTLSSSSASARPRRRSAAPRLPVVRGPAPPPAFPQQPAKPSGWLFAEGRLCVCSGGHHHRAGERHRVAVG